MTNIGDANGDGPQLRKGINGGFSADLSAWVAAITTTRADKSAE
jgi:hypothetical protein